MNDDSLKNFRESYVFHCLVIKVLIRCLSDSSFTLSYFILFVNTEFLIYFQILKQMKYSKIFWRYYIVSSKPHTCWHLRIILTTLSWSSPHPISSSQLHVLPHFHPCPIDLVVFKGVYSFRMGYLILRGASRLDAFSVYPFRAWLPGYRLGSLTGAPAARPSRSSRTKDSSSQISSARAG